MKKIILVFQLLLFLLPISNVVAADQAKSIYELENKIVAPDFSLKDVDGKTHKLSDYRGKVVMINFWATWCPPCRFELPSMQRAYEKLKLQNVEFLAINLGEDADTIFTFTADYPVTFPLLMDLDSSVSNMYPVIGLPTTYFVNPEGRLVYRAIGSREWDEEQMIEKILSLKNVN
jgi:peroxiredoxin